MQSIARTIKVNYTLFGT